MKINVERLYSKKKKKSAEFEPAGKKFKDRAGRNGEKSQVRLNSCRRSPSRSRINSARRRQFGRRLSCENRARVALVATSYYYRTRCCPECSHGGWYESTITVVAFPIYAIQRCAMPFTGENMKTPPLYASRALLEALPPCFCSRIRICLSYIFALYRELPRFSGWRVARTFSLVFSHYETHLPRLSERKMSVN